MTCFADSLASGNFQLSGYRCDELIYQSATTTVYRGIEMASQQRVVIKVLSQEYPSFEEIVRFCNQYAIAKALTSQFAKNLPIAGIVRPLTLLPCGNGYGQVICKMLTTATPVGALTPKWLICRRATLIYWGSF